jgi:cytochrome bd-type quinol oxidase subunit 1
MRTGQAPSPSVSTTDVAITLGGFTFLYMLLGIIDVVLMARAARGQLGGGAGDRPAGPEPGAPRELAADELIY